MKFPWSTSIVDVLNSDSKLDDKLQHIAKCEFLATLDKDNAFFDLFLLFVALTQHKEDISKVVEELGPALTHKDVEIRLKGTKFLTDLLRSLPHDLLDEKQLTFITQFYCDRMKRPSLNRAASRAWIERDREDDESFEAVASSHSATALRKHPVPKPGSRRSSQHLPPFAAPVRQLSARAGSHGR